MILLTLSRGKGEETVRLQLPASPAEIGETFAFLDRISLDTTATAILDVSSNVPVLYRCLYDVDVEDSEQFQKLQKLAERTEALSPAKAAIFSGALDAECVWNLEGALTVADRLDEYMLVNNVSSDSELGIYLVNKGIINAYNLFAIYLRWCIEHDLMGEGFLNEYGEVAKQVKADPASVDLRAFIRDKLNGQIMVPMFNKIGRAFTSYYYGEPDSPNFPRDIENYALEYLGPEKYYSDEFQFKAPLFIPFDEDYYQAMAKVIEERFTNWQGQDFDEDTLEPSELAEALMEYLDCECTYFPSMKDDDPIMSAYSYAKRESVKEGFVPVLIKADDETLWECLIMNSDPDSDGEDDYAFDPDKVADYRKKILSAPVKDSKAVLEALIGQRKEEAEDDDMDWDEEILGEMEGGEPNDRFSSYWDDDTEMTYPLILAEIPVKNPWEIFAYLPFGNWNDCPDTPDLMAAAKYWFEQYGAVPAAMSHDELEFLLPAPVPKEKAMDVAVELYGFCPDLDQNEDGSHCGLLGRCPVAVHRLVLLVGLMGDCDHERISEGIH